MRSELAYRRKEFPEFELGELKANELPSRIPLTLHSIEVLAV